MNGTLPLYAEKAKPEPGCEVWTIYVSDGISSHFEHVSLEGVVSDCGEFVVLKSGQGMLRLRPHNYFTKADAYAAVVEQIQEQRRKLLDRIDEVMAKFKEEEECPVSSS